MHRHLFFLSFSGVLSSSLDCYLPSLASTPGSLILAGRVFMLFDYLKYAVKLSHLLAHRQSAHSILTPGLSFLQTCAHPRIILCDVQFLPPTLAVAPPAE